MSVLPVNPPYGYPENQPIGESACTIIECVTEHKLQNPLYHISSTSYPTAGCQSWHTLSANRSSNMVPLKQVVLPINPDKQPNGSSHV